MRRALCRSEELAEGAARGFAGIAGGEDDAIFVLRRKGLVYGYRNRCPHTGITLNWMPDAFLDISGYFIICSTHGALFQPHDGLCVRGPCVGARLPVAAVEDVGGSVWLLDDECVGQ